MSDPIALFYVLAREPLTLAGLAALFTTPALIVRRRNKTAWHRRLRRKELLTANETEFFFRLQRALPRHRVFPQVAFAAFLTDDGKLSARARWSIRAKFDRKIADFVVCDGRSLKIIALIELDDRIHVAITDRQRDALTKAAGYQTFRFSSRAKPTETELADLFRHMPAWSS